MQGDCFTNIFKMLDTPFSVVDNAYIFVRAEHATEQQMDHICHDFHVRVFSGALVYFV